MNSFMEEIVKNNCLKSRIVSHQQKLLIILRNAEDLDNPVYTSWFRDFNSLIALSRDDPQFYFND